MAKYKVLELDGNCLKIDLGRYKDCVDLSPLASDISANWGSIGGTLSNQTDLQTALNLKANTSALSAYLTTANAATTYFPLVGGLLTGTAGNGKVTFPTQSSAPSTPASGFSLYANATNALSWKGANGFIRVFDGTSNTADRIYTLPDASGTFGLLGSTQTWTGLNTFGGSTTPTHSITLASTSTGWVHHNKVDQTVNYQRIRAYWNSNVYTISSEKGGSQTVGDIALAVGGTVYDTLFSTGRRFLGASPTDDGVSTLNVNGAAKIAGTLSTQSILASTDATYDIGSLTQRYNGVYTKGINSGANSFILSTNNIEALRVFTTQNVSIGGPVSDVPSAKVSIHSTTQGFLLSRMTTAQKNAISSPATGLIVFDTDLGKLCIFATTWQTITSV